MRTTAVMAFAMGAMVAPLAQGARPPARGFDRPLDTKIVKLAETKDRSKTTITCSYYAHFMVKQIDEGEVGAAQLSIVPGDAAQKPVCQLADLAAEKVVKADEWSGYFKGVKGEFVFFDAADGVNDAMGFAVFDAGAKKLLEDSALGDLRAVVDGATLTLEYQRSVTGECSVVHDGAACWAKIAATAGVAPTPAPDCAAGYLKFKTDIAKGRCDGTKTAKSACVSKALEELDAQHWNESPSVIVYAARTIIAGGKPTTTSLGPAKSCRPAE